MNRKLDTGAMRNAHPTSVHGSEALRIQQQFPSFRDFVDDCLFHPEWGYYSTGNVRFGEGGHYDTFPIALSPYFGHIVARYAYRRWRAFGQPSEMEIGEIGAGNGQLALDTALAIDQPLRRSADWERFAQAVRYRIIERSPALIERQRANLGTFATRVRWLQADLSQKPARGTPLADHGILVANEVLDCLAHHKIVSHPQGGAGVVHVVPRQGKRGTPLSSAELAQALTSPRLRKTLHFDEVPVPLDAHPDLQVFIERYYPELLRRRSFPPCFVCPETETLIHNTSSLYKHADALWIDYGEDRSYHLRQRETRKVFAGPPRSGKSLYAEPGRDDVTFMVDFSLAAEVAERHDWRVIFYGGQRELARRSGVRLNSNARARILEQRILHWMLAVLGVGPEQEWRRTALTWRKGVGPRLSLEREVEHTVQEFLGTRPSYFKLLLLRR